MRNQSNLTKYRILAPIYDKLIGRPIFRTARQRALALVEVDPADRVLLVGVGTGEDLEFLQPSTGLVGIDLSEKMLDTARTKFPNAELRIMNAESLGYPDSSFDKIVLNLVLSVAENPKQALSEALRVLKPEGRIVVFDKFLPAGETPPSPPGVQRPHLLGWNGHQSSLLAICKQARRLGARQGLCSG